MKKVYRFLFIIMLITTLFSCSNYSVIEGKHLTAKNFYQKFQNKKWRMTGIYAAYVDGTYGQENLRDVYIPSVNIVFTEKNDTLTKTSTSINLDDLTPHVTKGTYSYDELTHSLKFFGLDFSPYPQLKEVTVVSISDFFMECLTSCTDRTKRDTLSVNSMFRFTCSPNATEEEKAWLNRPL